MNDSNIRIATSMAFRYTRSSLKCLMLFIPLTAGKFYGVFLFLDLLQQYLPVIPLDDDNAALNGPAGTTATL